MAPPPATWPRPEQALAPPPGPARSPARPSRAKAPPRARPSPGASEPPCVVASSTYRVPLQPFPQPSAYGVPGPAQQGPFCDPSPYPPASPLSPRVRRLLPPRWLSGVLPSAPSQFFCFQTTSACVRCRSSARGGTSPPGWPDGSRKPQPRPWWPRKSPSRWSWWQGKPTGGACVAAARISPSVTALTSSSAQALPHSSSRPRRPAWWPSAPVRPLRGPRTAMAPTEVRRCRRQKWAPRSEAPGSLGYRPGSHPFVGRKSSADPKKGPSSPHIQL